MGRLFLVMLGIITCLVGCGYKYKYNDNMDLIADKIRLDPHNQVAWVELEEYTRSSYYWNRHSAYTHFMRLSMDGLIKHYPHTTSVYERGLKDKDTRIQKICVKTLPHISSTAVDQFHLQVINILKREKENSLSWSSAGILGVAKDIKNFERILDALFLEMSKPLPADTQVEWPQTRVVALESAESIARLNLDNKVISKFETLSQSLSGNSPADYDFKKRLNQTIETLKSEYLNKGKRTQPTIKKAA